MRIREPWPLARTRQRRREFAAVFEAVPKNSLGDALEIGAGDGFLATLLAPHCRALTTTDSYRARLAAAADNQTPRRLVCDARHLPFADASFDFIFSSSVLEHVRDRPVALGEMHRCLRAGGVMLHIMPSRTWKLLQIFFYYPHLLLGAADLLLQRLSRKCGAHRPALPAAVGERWSDRCNWRLSLGTILHGAVPRVHGEFAGHVSEWRGFGARPWIEEFETAGFAVHRVLLLPLYSGFGFGLDRARRIAERLSFSSHNAFVITRRGDAPPNAVLRWFDHAPARALPGL